MLDWTTLFAAPSDCECKNCNSVFSPASYLVDIMQYLDNCPSNNGSGESVLQVLLKRRPDIENLLLTCENTNTEIPYIDLVNEIMEYYVLNYNRQSQGLPAPAIPPDPALARDTGSATAQELKAEPQYILLDAYKTLYLQVYPFNLPYHQPLDVIRSYLGFLKTSRAELLQAFPNYPSPPPTVTLTPISSAAIDAEMLQLSLMEYEILTSCDFSGASATPKPNVVDYFGESPSIQVGVGIPASELLQQIGLDYTGLLAILETKFVNPGQDALNVLQSLVSRSSSTQVTTLYSELKANTWQSDSSFVALLTAAGIATADFQQWLTVNFPKIQQVITLYEADSGCDLTKTFLYSIQCVYETPPGNSPTPIADPNITDSFLSRLHRFIRLWHKSEWTIHELDNIITALGEIDITPELIHKLAAAQKVNTSLKLPRLKLGCLWGDIDTVGDNSTNPPTQSLYAQLFLNNTSNVTTGGSPQASVFAPDPLGGLLTSTPVPQLADHLPEIFAALGISADDYAAIVADANLPNGNLSLANLSTLYRYKVLAGALAGRVPDLPIQKLCILKSCLGSNPFTGPDGTVDFLQKFEKFQNSGFNVDILNYVLNGSSKAIDDIALTQLAILGALPSLRDAVSKIDSDNPNPNSDPNVAAKTKQLKVTQVISSISSLTGLDAVTISALIAADIDALIGDLAAVGLNADYFNNTQWTDPPALQRIDPAIDFAWGTSAPDPSVSADKFTVRWTGWICPPADGDYTFTIQITEADESAALWIDGELLFSLNRADIAGSLSGVSGHGTISLKGGTLYPIKVEYAETTDTAGIQLFWESATLLQAVIDTQFLYPGTKVQDFVNKVSLYHRAAKCIRGVHLSAAEVSYFLTNSVDFGGITFLPTNTVQWLRLCDYTALRKIIPAKLLLSIFQEAAAEDTASSGALPSDSLISAIATANQPGWNKDYLSYLAGNQNTPPVPPMTGYFQYKGADFRNEIALLNIKRAMELAIKTKMPVSATGLPSWTAIETDATTSIDVLHSVAEQIKNAVKGKSKDKWLTTATQLNNGIRENRKQALISYLLTLNLVAPDGDGSVTDPEGLYEYLLLDVKMTAAVPTSRLIQATMAVQLFADRCLLGLEIEVQPDPQKKSPIDSNEWEWMKHYSVAAGLKKLFVYVENYLDPSLRDDKSAFFEDFESALKKSDITAENVENAFRNYLYKVNEVSNMEVCGMYHDTATQTLHVFARTHAAPYNYYYRTAMAPAGANSNSWTWSPWQPVQLDIKSIDDGDNSGVHLMPVIWKKRLFLFWPEFIEKTINPPNSGSQSFQDLAQASYNDPKNAPQKYWQVRLAWSEYANDKWTPKQLSKEALTPLMTSLFETTNVISLLAPTKPRQYSLRPAIDQDNVLLITLFIRYAGQLTWHDFTNFQSDAVPLGIFRLTDAHEKITIGGIPDWMAAEVDLDYIQQGDEIFQSTVFSSTFYEPFFQSLAERNKLSIAGSDFLGTLIPHKLIFSPDLAIPNFEDAVSYPFFYTDTGNNRTYFATPVTMPRRRPIFPGLNEIAVFRNAAGAPLRMFNTSSTAKPVMRAPVVAVAPGPFQPIAPITLEPVTAGFSPRKATGVRASSQVLPSINNLDTGMTNQNTIGRLAARGAAQYVSDFAVYRPPFLGGGNIYLPPGLFENNGLAFYTFYHPFASLFVKKLNQGGVAELLAADTAEFPQDSNYPDIDTNPARVANDGGSTFQNGYNPDFADVRSYVPADRNRNYYLENIDFSEYGTYSSYNWELFFHAPFLVATTLSKNGKYAEARQWFHYIFNPLSTEPVSTNPNSPFWQVLPFKAQLDQEIENYIASLQTGYDNDQQIDEWRADPYNAFKIARLRPIAFMKSVVMAYLDNLINWGDDLFRTYTRENINQATQLYVLAARILGPPPQYIPQRGTIDSYSYNELKAAGLDDFGDALVQLENVFPNSSDVQQTDNSVPQNLLGIGKALYFCIPPNDKLLQYWTRVGDRLFKIRHGQNIDGIVRPLALYEPPIDPELLLQAKAQGVDVAGVLAEPDVSPPLYRFSYLLLKAKEFCNEVVSLGSALLSANEKQDAEELSRLRQTQEIELLDMVTEVKNRQVLEAQANLDNLNSSRATAIQRLAHYVEELLGNQAAQVPDTPLLADNLSDTSALPGETIINQVTSSIDVSLTGTDESGVKVIPKEQQEMVYSEAAEYVQLGGNALETAAAIFLLLPDFRIMTSPFGVGADIQITGGQQIGDSISAAARAVLGLSSWLSAQAGSASRMAGFIRREQDWVFQANMAAREIIQLDKQIIAAQIRLQMARHELENHQQQIQNAEDIEQFLETKFSKQELYQWMIDRLQDAHKQGYQLAYDMARRAEKAYRFELGIQESNFVQYGYYNDAYLGITAGEQLQLALKQMEAAYLENNVREFELTKHVSLKQVNPLALLQLIEIGTCSFDLIEELFDMDYPGHYFRRIKSVGITMPCVAGPYTTVNSTLRLLANAIRIDPDTTSGYPHKTSGGAPIADDRFIENTIPFVAIATSSAQNDSGVFELNFRDERYLPFEGAGAISTWQLELNGKYISNGEMKDFSQFDYDTITDVVIHVRYTAREPKQQEDRQTLKDAAVGTLPPQSLTQLFSLRHDFPSQWQAFLNLRDPNTGDQTCEVPILSDRMPYFLSKFNPKVTNIALYVETASQLPAFRVTSPGGTANSGYSFGPDPTVGALMVSNPSGQSWGDNNLGVWKIVNPGQPALSADDVQDIYCLVTYAI